MKIYHSTSSNFLIEEADFSKNIIKQLNDFAEINKLEKIIFSEDTFVLYTKNKEGEVVGLLQFYYYEKYKEIYVSWVMVDEHYRGHRLLTNMLRYLKVLSKSYDIDVITLYCLKTNKIANVIYKKLGFIQQSSKAVKLSINDSSRFNGYSLIRRIN